MLLHRPEPRPTLNAEADTASPAIPIPARYPNIRFQRREGVAPRQRICPWGLIGRVVKDRDSLMGFMIRPAASAFCNGEVNTCDCEGEDREEPKPTHLYSRCRLCDSLMCFDHCPRLPCGACIPLILSQTSILNLGAREHLHLCQVSDFHMSTATFLRHPIEPTCVLETDTLPAVMDVFPGLATGFACSPRRGGFFCQTCARALEGRDLGDAVFRLSATYIEHTAVGSVATKVRLTCTRCEPLSVADLRLYMDAYALACERARGPRTFHLLGTDDASPALVGQHVCELNIPPNLVAILENRTGILCDECKRRACAHCVGRSPEKALCRSCLMSTHPPRDPTKYGFLCRAATPVEQGKFMKRA